MQHRNPARKAGFFCSAAGNRNYGGCNYLESLLPVNKQDAWNESRTLNNSCPSVVTATRSIQQKYNSHLSVTVSLKGWSRGAKLSPDIFITSHAKAAKQISPYRLYWRCRLQYQAYRVETCILSGRIEGTGISGK